MKREIKYKLLHKQELISLLYKIKKSLFTQKAYGWLGSGVLADWLMPKASNAYLGQKEAKLC